MILIFVCVQFLLIYSFFVSIVDWYNLIVYLGYFNVGCCDFFSFLLFYFLQYFRELQQSVPKTTMPKKQNK